MREQMVISVEESLPAAKAELPSRVDDIPRQPTSSHDSERQIPLQRINTSVSSILRPENGNRLGGFVLVVDGAALLQVGLVLSSYVMVILRMKKCPQKKKAKPCYSRSPCSAMV